MTRRVWAVAVAVLIGLAAFAVWAGREPLEHDVLRQVYTPTFSPVPPKASFASALERARELLRAPAGHDFKTRWLPDQGATLWLMLIVMLAVAFDYSRIRSPRNIDLVLALALGITFFDILAFARLRLDPEYWTMLDAVFTAVTMLNLALIARAIYHAWKPERLASGWLPHLRGRPLAALALALVVANAAVTLVREPDDAGYFTNLGAQRFRERGRLPYGDPLLTGTPGAAYGPVLYAAHVPFQMLLEPRSANATSPALPLLGADATYLLPPPLATQLTTLTLHLAGLLALWVTGRRMTGSTEVGWALVALYASSAFVLGVGGDRELIGGVTFISHIGPSAATLIAFACLGSSPGWAGGMLAVATGAGFYPAFMLPAWAGFYWNDRRTLQRFLVGFALAAAVIGGATLALSRAAHDKGLVGTILSDTFGHHTDPQGYGQSPFGFWGQREGIRRWLATPLVGQSGLTTPAYAMFFGLVGAAFFIARGRSPATLAFLTAAIAFAASTIKIHSTGTYVAWAYPFLLIGLFAAGEQPAGASRE